MELHFLLVYLFMTLNAMSLSFCAENWWSTGKQLVLDPSRVCAKTKRLKPRQAKICRYEKETVSQIIMGVEVGREECRHQFQSRRWNCTAERKSIRRVIDHDTRETGFLHAITAAGVAYSIAEACSKGTLLGCSCDNTIASKERQASMRSSGLVNVGGAAGRMNALMSDVNGGSNTVAAATAGRDTFDWRGCSDNIDYGYLKSIQFLNVKSQKSRKGRRELNGPQRRKKRKLKGDQRSVDMRTLLMMHNYEAGRLAVRNNMRTICKCHGLSGSCSFKTCWRALPHFRDVGNQLKQKFDSASKVTSQNDGHGFVTEDRALKTPTREDLVYAEESANFCDADPSTGSLGTSGRACDPASAGPEGCDLLCCGRGSVVSKETQHKHCNCRLVNYSVQCSMCKVDIDVHHCL